MGSITPAPTPSTTSLPDSKSPSLVLTHPTPEERIATWKLNAVNWGSALSQADYLQRETYLMTVPLARDGGITHWILVESSLPPNNRPILAACESLRKPVLVSRNGVLTHEITHGIGSVFSAPEYRGRGYASRMLTELGRVLKTWQTDPSKPGMERCSFSILYSDIGKKYYSKFGWGPFPSSHISFPPAPKPTTLTTAKPLSYDDLPQLCALDEESVQKQLVAAKDGKTHVALLPNHDCMQWHHLREDFVTPKVVTGTSPPTIKGAIAGDQPGSRIWAYFTRAYYGPLTKMDNGNTLHILRLVIEDESDTEENARKLKGIIEIAQGEAQEWKLGEVELWNPSEVVMALVKRVGVEFREVERQQESIASLMWYGDAEEEVVWEQNEKYGWC
jgi:GNAT superfamily N-acetyltransferase